MRRRRLKLALHRFYPGTLSKEFIEVSVCWFRCECWDLTATETQLCRLACNTICLTTNMSLERIFSTGFVWLNLSGSWLTFQHILLHLNLIEFVGADNDAVASEVDTAAGLWCLNFLQKQTKFSLFFSSSLLPKVRQKMLPSVCGIIILPLTSQAHPPSWCRTCSDFHYVEEL